MNTIRRFILFVAVTITPGLLLAEDLTNPVRFPSIAKFIEGTLEVVTMIALPIIALFMVYAGFKYVLARGNSEKIRDAHTNFLYVVIGAGLILGAWIFAKLIEGTVLQLTTGT
jgi:hypothetical protein